MLKGEVTCTGLGWFKFNKIYSLVNVFNVAFQSMHAYGGNSLSEVNRIYFPGKVFSLNCF